MRRKTRSGKAGLRFPVARIHNLLKHATCSMRISGLAPVYLTAVLEYLTAEILETAGVVAKQCQHPRITPRHIQIAAKGDEEMGKLLADVTLSEGGVLPEEYKAQLYPQQEKKEKKKKETHKKKKYQDMRRIHIGGPNTQSSKKKEPMKRKRSFSCGGGMDRSTFSKRAEVREKNGPEDPRHGIGLAFAVKDTTKDKTNSTELKSTEPKANLSFQGCEQIFGGFNRDGYDLQNFDHTLETSWRNEDHINTSLGSNVTTYGDQFYNESFQSFRELFQTSNNESFQTSYNESFQRSHNESFLGFNQSFQGSFEGSFLSQQDGRSNMEASSAKAGFTSPFNSVSYRHQQSSAVLESRTEDFPFRSSLQTTNPHSLNESALSFGAPNPQNFNESVLSFGAPNPHNLNEYAMSFEATNPHKFTESSMKFEDFILERSNIPTDLLEMTLQGVCPKKIDKLKNNNVSRDDEISMRRSKSETPKTEEISPRNNNQQISKKITLKDWKSSKEKGGSMINTLIENMNQKTVLHDDSKIKNLSFSPEKEYAPSPLFFSPEKMDVEPNLSSKPVNIVNRLISDFQIYSESDSCETLHVDESIDRDVNGSKPILPAMPDESNHENVFERNDTKNDDENVSLQDCQVSSSLAYHGSVSSPVNSDSIKSPIEKPCPGSKRKHNVGDVVWARLDSSSFYPAVVINEAYNKFHTKIVETSPNSNENDNRTSSRQYHVQFLYKSSRRAWIGSSRIIRYEGITKYEERVKKDVGNMNMYRPRNSSLKLQWREAVLTAKRLESLGKMERVRKCEEARFKWDLRGKEKNEDPNLAKQYSLMQIGDQENICQESNGKDKMTLNQLAMPKKCSPGQRKKLEQMEHGGQNGSNPFQSSDKNDRHISSQKNKFRSNLAISKDPQSMKQQIVTTKIVPNDKIKELKKVDNDKIKELKEVDCVRKIEEFQVDKVSSTSNSELQTNIISSSLQKTNGLYKGEENATFQRKEEKMMKTKIVTTVTEDDNLARPGDLVWGRMSGFPHWPGFVTKYHVQFFNWNSESGWVNSIVKFYGVDHFKKTKTFRAMKLKSLEQKWLQAAQDAEATIGMSRKERLNKYLVPYDEV